MKERPILFSAPMVRAILEGRKSMTRRAVKPQPPQEAIAPTLENGWWMWQRFNVERRHYDGKTVDKIFDRTCPYGNIGDKLWVRESWRTHGGGPLSECTGPNDIDFAADSDEFRHGMFRWRPSIHMPRWASRILLEITNVRVERLQEIDEDDAEAEGCDRAEGVNPQRWATDIFQELWESINGPGSWEANPWVWVVEFKRLK